MTVRDVGTARVEHHCADRVIDWAGAERAEVNHRDVGFRAWRQPTQVVPPEQSGAAQRGCTIQIRVGPGGLVSRALLGQIGCVVQRADHVGRKHVSANGEVHLRGEVRLERIECAWHAERQGSDNG